MTVRSSIDPARLLEEQLAQASPDLLRELLQTFINTLLSAEAEVRAGSRHEVGPDCHFPSWYGAPGSGSTPSIAGADTLVASV